MGHCGSQRRIAACRGDGAVELAVVAAGRVGQGHVRMRRSAIRFDQHAGFKQVEGADVVAIGGAGRGRAAGRREPGAVGGDGDEHPRPDPHFDIALDLQRDQGFADRRPADLQLFRQFAFGRQARAAGEIARPDAAGDLVGDHAVQTGSGDGLERTHDGFGDQNGLVVRPPI
ncbi:hypothetical protein G6F22_018089 [Rhizopus arrhizus]|nr:hypothetical protein G6F22_018089 [Rhizopus arrhizus]